MLFDKLSHHLTIKENVPGITTGTGMLFFSAGDTWMTNIVQHMHYIAWVNAVWGNKKNLKTHGWKLKDLDWKLSLSRCAWNKASNGVLVVS